MKSRLAWTTWSVVMLGARTGVWLWVLNARTTAGVFAPQAFIVPGYTTVGAVIMSRSTNRIGSLFVGFGFLATTTLLTFEYAVHGIIGGHPPGTAVAAWVQNWSWPLNFLFLGSLMLIFPDGRLLSRRWRVAAIALAVTWLTSTAYGALDPQPLELAAGLHIANPFGSHIVRFLPLYPVLANAGFASLIACAAAPIVRYRRAGDIERHQLKWLAGVLGMILMSVPAVAVLNAVSPPLANLVSFVPIFGVCVGIPAAIGIAVLRYRLYEIDKIISRTISYAIVSGWLAGTFFLFVLVPTSFLGGRRIPGYLVAGATLVIATLFRPVRQRVQSAVDRRFNRARYDAAQTVASFTARLREQTDIDALEAELGSVVSRSMQPAHVSLWLRKR